MPIPRQSQRANQPSAASSRLSRTLLLAPDLQQSVLAELDSSRLTPFAYSAYGFQSGPFPTGAHLAFNGQIKEPSTGWYHLGNGHRVYNPVLMRFHSPDRLSPFGKGGVNAYAYCEGDPVNYEDPSGEYGQAIARLVQLAATTALHVGIVTTNLVGAKATGWMLHAARMSTVASTTAVVGTVGQLAGLPAAVYISNVATTVSAAATMVRYVPIVANGFRSGTLWKTVKNNVRNLVQGTAFPTPPEVPPSSVSGSKVAEPVSIQMATLPSTSTSTSTHINLLPETSNIRQGGVRRRHASL